jgi:hypothetical protein
MAASFCALLVEHCMCLCVVCMCIYDCGAACSVLHLVVSFSSSSEDESLVQCYAIWIVDGSYGLGALVIGNMLSYPRRLHYHQHLVNLKSSIVQVLIGSHS